MKLKYYLRGAGTGVIVTTIILMILGATTGYGITDAQIIERAKKLGMVMVDTPDTQKNPTGEQGKETEDSSAEEKPAPVIPPSTELDPNKTYHEIPVYEKEGAEAMARRLLEKGLISDVGEFVRYIREKQVGEIYVGTYMIPEGVTFDEIIAIVWSEEEQKPKK